MPNLCPATELQLFHLDLVSAFSLAAGASVDPAGVTMLDAIKIYGKTKEQFGWPDEPPEDFPSASVSNICPPNLNQGNGTGETEPATPAATSGTVLER